MYGNKTCCPSGISPGPLLFLLYKNDLPLNVQDAKLVLFVDDINILIIHKNIDAVQERLNKVIRQFGIWFSNNSLIINTDKTKAMLFHFNKTCNLVMSKIVFFLGINISNNLKCNIHIQFLCSKLNTVSYMITSLRVINNTSKTRT